ncbi:hypothetical protein [Pseudoduganella namucuonensis]|uniref:Uncharacterized protein n=1 Tax=Pseudoduganella namucuonensis TaxID=1035707 RepID=A0A1I7LYI6_9BURK|nr:hypothetical protein [Pseudoduganella namucuonensis]SFV14753.1 hypothetical protein SAMN05216552_104348 [Pseudoduganella namucuonensis]
MQQPNEVFERAREARLAGRYQDALKDHLWLHEHALEVSPEWRGVRLSFALRDWIYLAELFPPARAALQAIRERESARMLGGAATVERFREIAAINEALREVQATHQLFLSLDGIDSAIAEQCAELAMTALVKCEDFQLARRFLPSPAERIAALAERLNDGAEALSSQPASAAPTLLAYVLNYAKEVRLVLAVLRGMEEDDEADNMMKAALDQIRSDGLRAIMQRELEQPGSTLAAMARQSEAAGQ